VVVDLLAQLAEALRGIVALHVREDSTRL
jgi:hypothetical protein